MPGCSLCRLLGQELWYWSSVRCSSTECNFFHVLRYLLRKGKELSLHTSQVAYEVGAFPGFCSMKRLEVFLLPPGWDASPSQGYPALSSPVPIHTPGWNDLIRLILKLMNAIL